MNVAGATKLACRRHRGAIDEAGAPFIEHLDRAAALAVSAGGGPCEQMAVWLSGVGRTGLEPGDLAALRVPRRVIRIVGALTPGHRWESAASQAARIRPVPGATLVLLALTTDRYRPEALPRVPRYDRDRDRELLTILGLPLPAALAGSASAPPEPAGDVTALLSQLRARGQERWNAVRELGTLGDIRALRPLTDAYLAAVAGHRRWASGVGELAGALSRIASQHGHQGDQRWVQAMADLAEHPDGFLRATALRALAGLPAYEALAVLALSDDNPAVADAAIEALDANRTGMVSAELLAIARRRERAWTWARRAAVRRLVQAGDPAGPDALLAALEVDGMGLGQDAILALVAATGWPVVPELIRQLRDTAPGRAAAAFALGERRARDAVGDLIKVLDGEADGHAAVECVQALGKIADPAAVPALVNATRHRLALVRAAALGALAGFDDPLVAEAALAACDDLDPDVRDRAIRLLARRGDQRAVSRLLSACDGPLAPVALRGLIRIADERAVPLLVRLFLSTADRRVRKLSGRAIARSARTASGLFLGSGLYLGEQLAQLRAAAWILGEIGDKNSAWALTRQLTHHDELVRARSAAALGKIGDPDSAADLRRALDDISPRVRASAATALGKLGNADGRRWLKPLRHDPHPAVRMAAEAASRRLG